MRRCLVLLVCIFFSFAKAQEKIQPASLKIILPTENTFGNVVSDEVIIPIIDSTETKPKVDITSEFWDTVNYNPYRNEIIKFPFKINFKDSVYASPVKHEMVVTSHYGWRHGRPHKGIDLDLVTGDSVVAILDGVVRLSRYSRTFGNYIVIRHYNGLESTYAHLSRRAVKVNDSIIKGQYIGKGGNSGRSAGSHLHFETSYKGQYIHPEYILDFSESKKIRSQTLWVTRDWTRASFFRSTRKPKLELLTTEAQALAKNVKIRKVYIVKGGDTLSRISQRNNVSINAICKTNRIRRSSTLRIGQKLILEL